MLLVSAANIFASREGFLAYLCDVVCGCDVDFAICAY